MPGLVSEVLSTLGTTLAGTAAGLAFAAVPSAFWAMPAAVALWEAVAAPAVADDVTDRSWQAAVNTRI